MSLFPEASLSQSSVHQMFVDYFGDIDLRRFKREGNYTIYACTVQSGLMDTRVIYAIVLSRFAVRETVKLSELAWVSFQTRTTDEHLPMLPKNSVIPTKAAKEYMQQFVFHSVNRTDTKTDYRSHTVPLEMSILNDTRRKNFLQCPDRANLVQAVESYRCIVNAL